MALSVARIPDHGVEVFFVGFCCTTQIAIEFLVAELWGGGGKADKFIAGCFACLLLGCTDSDALGHHPEDFAWPSCTVSSGHHYSLSRCPRQEYRFNKSTFKPQLAARNNSASEV